MRSLIGNTFDHDDANPDFVQLVSIENIHHAMHMRRSSEIADLNVSVIRTIQDIVDRGLRSGVFKRRADAIEVHFRGEKRVTEPFQIGTEWYEHFELRVAKVERAYAGPRGEREEEKA